MPYAFNADRVDGLDAADFAAATHDHWGETWSGSGTGLTLNSSGGGPTLNISNGDNDAIYVPSAGGNGVEVHAAGEDGFYVSTAGDDGMQIGFQTWLGDYVGASDDGIVIYDAGNAPTHTLPVDVFGVDTHDGIDIAGAADFGLWVGSAGRGGVLVNNTEGNGFTVVDAGSAGVHVDSAGSDGVYVGFVGGNGVYVMSADWDGVFANTARNDHEWGFDTPDKIQAMNVTMRSLSVIARNDGPVSLQAGDLVAVTGVDRPLLGGSTPMPNVRRADGRFTGVIGVVESRMELTVVDPMEEWAERAEAPPNVKPEDVIHEEAHSATGDAAPGEYVSIVVFGITDVKVDATAGAIEPGQRLTAANLAGHARGLQSRLLDGMLVTEGAPTIGIALEPLEKGTGAIPVFVTLQ